MFYNIIKNDALKLGVALQVFISYFYSIIEI
ncbi:hypothetical protein MTsPCn5_38990 [Croceitalea sp. MTPC5]|nr:hypothetical protein MTsPCn5_38990 [Croceitalea sp. MTPC5]